jgi:succinyl-CoA synthetase beta subunit
MKLHEYQGKQILKSYGIPISDGVLAETVQEAVEGAKQLYDNLQDDSVFVVKAQVHAGGRGKGGGVKLAKGLQELEQVAGDIIGMNLVTPQTGEAGVPVRKVLVTPDAFYPGPNKPKEYYLSITLDRTISQDVIMASEEGGVDIEEVAERSPEKIIKEHVDPRYGLQPFQARRIAIELGFEGDAFKNAVKFILKLYKAYQGSDAGLIEINPMLRTSDDQILALDTKYDLEDSALFRHPDYQDMRDTTEEDPLETQARENNLNYIKLDGNVGCMVNGAGLAMATMDMIKLSGGEPANFLDVGGAANPKTVEAAFRIILQDPNVKAILINIFGGIVQCDRVASGVVEAYKSIGEINIPIIVRLQGTNAEEGKKIIEESGLQVTPAILLREAAEEVKTAVS